MFIFVLSYLLVGILFYFIVEGFQLTWNDTLIFDFDDHNVIYFFICAIGWSIVLLIAIITFLFTGTIKEED